MRMPKNLKTIFYIGAGLLILLLPACSNNTEQVVDRINLIQGDKQCAPPNAECKTEIRLELLGPPRTGVLGGVNRYPVAGTRIRVEPIAGCDLVITPVNEVSDPGGMVKLKVRTGKNLGDQYFKVIPELYPEKAKKIRIISGIEISGNKQEAYSSKSLPKPISIKVFDQAGKPAPGASVYFHIISSPDKKVRAACLPGEVITDQDGIAETKCKVGRKTGEYKILVEVVDLARGFHIRGIEVTAYGKNVFGLTGLLITVLGGLAIFIFGMKQMSDGLQLVAGEKMKSILQFFASNRFIAVGAGALVTGVIQSSSACSVMVVGFVNAGLLNLQQAIGILLGANIGTTITAQMISFKLGGLALPAIIIGLLVVMLAKKTTYIGWGQTLLGFGLLFFGMTMMGHELKLIGKFPSFIHFFQQFDCTPVNGYMPVKAVLGAILIGTVMTVVIQSSSATIGIALALASSGLLNFYTAIPLILGDNIGTTVTGVLASIGTNKRAQQTAISNVFIKFFGTIYMIFLFYVPYPGTDIPIFMKLVNSITVGNVFLGENITRHIAMAHTSFNMINLLFMLPFIAFIAKLCNGVIKIREEEKVKVKHLEPHLLNTPSIALDQAINSIRYMVVESWDMVDLAMTKNFIPAKVNKKMVKELDEREDKIDNLQEKTTDYLVQLTTRQLTEPQAEIIPLLMHCTNDAERIADHTENIIALAKRVEASKHQFSEEAMEEVKNLWKILENQSTHVIACLENISKKDIKIALKDENKIDKLTNKLEKNHISRLKKGKCNVIAGIIFLELIADLEKVGDHLANIADRAPEIQKHHLKLG